MSMPPTAYHAYEHVREDLLRVRAEVVRVEHGGAAQGAALAQVVPGEA